MRPRAWRSGRMALGVGWTGLALLGGLAACAGDVSDAGDAGPARISIVTAFSTHAVGEGALRAFDASDILAVRIRSGSILRYEREIPISPAGSDVRAPVELDVRRGGETLTLELELRTNGAPLFQGGSVVALQRGGAATARVVLDPVVAGLSLSPDEVTLDAYGADVRVTATPVFATGDPIDGIAVEWSTLDAGVAGVDGGGTITAVGDGDTQVVARLGDFSASMRVGVFAVVSSVTIDPAVADIPLGTELRFAALLADRRGNPIQGRPVEWSSGNSTLIEVGEDGTAFARGIGRSDVRATSGDAVGVADAEGVPIPPGAAVERATALDPRTIEVVGGIRPNGLSTSALVEWARDSAFTTGVGRSPAQVVPAGVGEVTITLRPTGFRPGGRYFGRVLVENGVGTGQSGIFDLTLPIASPEGETGSPTSVTSGGATLGGRVDAGGAETRVRFQISRTAEFTVYWEVDGGVLAPGDSVQEVQVPVEGLEPGTTYCVRILLSNEAGERVGEAVCFETEGASPPPPPLSVPSVTTLPPGLITPTTARLNAAGPPGPASSVWFEWGTDPGLGATATSTLPRAVAAGVVVDVSADISGLFPGTTYHVRAVRRSGGVTRTGATLSFTTPTGGGPLAPSLGSVTVTEGPDGVRATASVNPNGSVTTVRFEGGTDPDPATFSSLPLPGIGGGTSPVSVTALLGVLPAGTTVYVRLVAENARGTSVGGVISFTTAGTGGGARPPSVATGATTVLSGGFKVEGDVNPRGLATVVWFEWGTDPGLGSSSRTPDQRLAAGAATVRLYAQLSGLTRGATYYVRVVAANAAGTTRGQIVRVVVP